MPEYLAPGVYIEEISRGARPIEGVSTSTTGFVGQTERGPTAPRLVTSWTEYLRWFGGFIDTSISFLPFAVRGFFDNGGKRAFIARVTGDGAISATLAIGPFQLRAIGPGAWGNNIRVLIREASQPGPPETPRFRLSVLYYTNFPEPFINPFSTAKEDLINPLRRDPDVFEDFDNLGIDPEGSNYVITAVNAASKLVEFDELPPGTAPEAPTPSDELLAMEGGADGADATPTQYIGDPQADPDLRTGLAGLEVIDEISLLCIPDEVRAGLDDLGDLRSELILQCERLRDRFAILQIRGSIGDVQSVIADLTQDSSYAAIYYPWVRVADPRKPGETFLMPPGGHVAGIIARTDIERGVHKAPANAVVRGIVTTDLNGNKKPLQYPITKGGHDILNPRGINVIRDFRADGLGIRLYGARTISSDPIWRYVNVRRLFLYVEESIEEGTQWVVFEPNYEATWDAVRRTVTSFLGTVWRSGALFGTTEEEAFFVKCDRTTMTPDDIENGRLICYIGIAPVKPAEFVIFRISQKTVEF